ncbi:plasmid mobilization protein [Rubrivirga marina]|uniref:Uncharacterized protein n=1 Tax=Rubrivirga marina TaxID=1196024 RepID=A0A271ITB4_9BACT|nr:hypothetical protein [Rubrivirga marina]PAP74158.1 hypothetical protein BSZ37_21065 [Rubrivirga marina]
MAKKTDREAMAAALGGMVSRPKPEAAEPAGTEDKETNVAPVSTVTPLAPDESVGGDGYRRTGTGYVKADGTKMVRTVVMVTEAERRRLKALALEAGLSPSDYVRRALGFV